MNDNDPSAPGSPHSRPSMLEIILRHEDPQAAVEEIARCYPEASPDQINATLLEALYAARMAGERDEGA